jgi:hypothetical protein
MNWLEATMRGADAVTPQLSTMDVFDASSIMFEFS